jgi:hypothetical protein
MMKAVIGITDVLCQALQQQHQDVINVMDFVRSKKRLIQNLRDNGWDELLSNVTSFCQRHSIEILGLNYVHSATRSVVQSNFLNYLICLSRRRIRIERRGIMCHQTNRKRRI